MNPKELEILSRYHSTLCSIAYEIGQSCIGGESFEYNTPIAKITFKIKSNGINTEST